VVLPHHPPRADSLDCIGTGLDIECFVAAGAEDAAPLFLTRSLATFKVGDGEGDTAFSASRPPQLLQGRRSGSGLMTRCRRCSSSSPWRTTGSSAPGWEAWLIDAAASFQVGNCSAHVLHLKGVQFELVAVCVRFRNQLFFACYCWADAGWLDSGV